MRLRLIPAAVLLRPVRRGRRKRPRRRPPARGDARTYDEPEARAAEIRATEHRGDEISHDIGHRLEARRSSRRSIARDISRPDQRLDDVLDFIEETADTFVLYRIEAPTATAVEQASIVVKQVELIHGSAWNT